MGTRASEGPEAKPCELSFKAGVARRDSREVVQQTERRQDWEEGRDGVQTGPGGGNGQWGRGGKGRCRQDREEGRDSEAREWRARGLYLFPVASHGTNLRLGEATETSPTVREAGSPKSSCWQVGSFGRP